MQKNINEPDNQEIVDEDHGFEDFEYLIINNIIFNESYREKSFSNIDYLYFESEKYGIIFEKMESYSEEYNSIPSKEILSTIIQQDKKIDQTLKVQTLQSLKKLFAKHESKDDKWLLDQSERWIKEQALHNAILECSDLYNKGLDDDSVSYEVFAQIIEKATSVSLKGSEIFGDSNDGDDSFLDEYIEYLCSADSSIPFGLKIFNIITNGGIAKNTLSIVAGGTGSGKTANMISLMSDYLSMGLNCLYITFELDQKKTMDRLYSNFSSIPLEELKNIRKNDRSYVEQKIKSNYKKRKGCWYIRECVIGADTIQTCEQHIRDILSSKGVQIDVVFVDQLKNMKYSEGNKSTTDYQRLDKLAIQLRGMAMKHNIAVWTAMQLNRGSEGKEYLSKEDIAESYAVAHTADFMYAIKYSEEFGAYKGYQLKNRFGDDNKTKMFLLGVDKSISKLYDMDQDSIDDNEGIIDNHEDVIQPQISKGNPFERKRTSFNF